MDKEIQKYKITTFPCNIKKGVSDQLCSEQHILLCDINQYSIKEFPYTKTNKEIANEHKVSEIAVKKWIQGLKALKLIQDKGLHHRDRKLFVINCKVPKIYSKIPFTALKERGLSARYALICGDIITLTYKYGSCFKDTATMAHEHQVDTTTITRCIQKLVKLGLVVQTNYKNGKRILKATIDVYGNEINPKTVPLKEGTYIEMSIPYTCERPYVYIQPNTENKIHEISSNNMEEENIITIDTIDDLAQSFMDATKTVIEKYGLHETFCYINLRGEFLKSLRHGGYDSAMDYTENRKITSYEWYQMFYNIQESRRTTGRMMSSINFMFASQEQFENTLSNVRKGNTKTKGSHAILVDKATGCYAHMFSATKNSQEKTCQFAFALKDKISISTDHSIWTIRLNKSGECLVNNREVSYWVDSFSFTIANVVKEAKKSNGITKEVQVYVVDKNDIEIVKLSV